MSVIVYTAILGGCDRLKPAPVGADRCVCFTDEPVDDPQGWELIVWPATANPRREAWRLRCVPQTIFATYTTVVWVDASFTVTDLPALLQDADGFALSAMRHHTRTSCYEEARAVVAIGQADAAAVDTQMDGYQQAGFFPSTLSIGCLLVRTSTAPVTAFNDRWNAEIRQHAGDNCQLSLDYCAWATGVGVHHLAGVRHANPYAVHDHADHKRRRKPYR